MRVLMNTKMVEGIPVRDYVLKIFDHLNTLKILSGEIDTESKIDIILESLPNSFNQFKLNCSMNKINFILSKLLNALQVVNSIIKSHHNINNVEKTLLSKLFPKEKGKQKSRKYQVTPTKFLIFLNLFRDIGKGKKVNDPKPKGKCFHIRVKDHRKMNCPIYLA